MEGWCLVMNKNLRWVFVSVLLLLIVSSCSHQIVVDEFTAELPPMTNVPQWESSRIESGFFNLVRYNDGKVLFAECDGHSSFKFTLLEPDYLKAEWSQGHYIMGSMYFDLEEGSVSPEYENIVATKFKKVAHLLDDRITLVVHDAFNEFSNRKEFSLDCLTQPVDTYMFPFETVEFLDEQRLHIIYTDSQNNLKEEILLLV
jgi:hypothetical protein